MKNKALYIVKELRNAGYESVLAGGCVRDMLLGIEPHDYDIATNALPEVVEELFPKTIPIGKSFGVIVVMIENEPFEVATFRKDIYKKYRDGRHPDTVTFTSMKEDANRRDFTINALFYDPIEDKVIDYVNGQKDLKNKILRFVGDPIKRIDEDHLRMLRAVRFAARFDLSINSASKMAIKENAERIHDVSNERIQDELTKLLRIGKPRIAIELLEETNLLKEVLPEVEAMRNVEQNPEWHPEGDVLNHTIIMMEKLFENTENPRDELIWAALLHDIGKPATFTVEDGKIRNHAHEFVGAEMAKEFMKNLKFSNKFTEDVYWLIHDHMRIKKATKMRKSKLKKLLAQENLKELMSLAYADSLSSTKMTEWHEYILEKINEFEPEEIKPKQLVNGHDLIRLGFKPGPIFKEILEEIVELQLEEKINTREEALEYARSKKVNS